MDWFEKISEGVQSGKAKTVKELVLDAVNAGIECQDIINKALIPAMYDIGKRFKDQNMFVPEVLLAARAMNMGMFVLKPFLKQETANVIGRVCIGTVEGDLHDIGKNLVKMFLESKGLEVMDLGTDVPAATFLSVALEGQCQVILCSALLSTTTDALKEIVDMADKIGVRNKFKIMIGGAPVTDVFCKKIGADYYTPDALEAANVAAKICKDFKPT